MSHAPFKQSDYNCRVNKLAVAVIGFVADEITHKTSGHMAVTGTQMKNSAQRLLQLTWLIKKNNKSATTYKSESFD
jgi:hypothetical protein